MALLSLFHPELPISLGYVLLFFWKLVVVRGKIKWVMGIMLVAGFYLPIYHLVVFVVPDEL